jgi:hypothetical protein
MRFFSSWWERVPTRHLSAVLALVAIVAVVGVQVHAPQGGSLAGKIHSHGPTGEVWT